MEWISFGPSFWPANLSVGPLSVCVWSYKRCFGDPYRANYLDPRVFMSRVIIGVCVSGGCLYSAIILLRAISLIDEGLPCVPASVLGLLVVLSFLAFRGDRRRLAL